MGWVMIMTIQNKTFRCSEKYLSQIPALQQLINLGFVKGNVRAAVAGLYSDYGMWIVRKITVWKGRSVTCGCGTDGRCTAFRIWC